MRNPNGYGSVVKLSGKRRNPFMVRKTAGFNEKNQPIYNIIGYAPTREAANIMLAKYNENPWNSNADKITFEEMYQEWKKSIRYEKLGDSNKKRLNAAYKHCSPIYNMRYKAVRASHVQACIDACKLSAESKQSIRALYKHLDDYALENDYITAQHHAQVSVAAAARKEKDIFTPEQIYHIYASHNDVAPLALLMLYSGYRIEELLGMRVEDVHLQEGYFRRGLKTAAGKDRMVPVHSRILPLVTSLIAPQAEYLVTNPNTGKRYTYAAFKGQWDNLMAEIGCAGMTSHCCRHTFRTALYNAQADPLCIDRIMGHASAGVGQSVYTHISLDQLKKAVELVTY